MLRRDVMIGFAALGLAACGGAPKGRIGPDGLPLPQVYRIGPDDTDDIQFRMLDSVNTLRGAAGVPPVQLNPLLNAAAATHARDMSVQNRPWLFGSDGSSPLDRARRVVLDPAARFMGLAWFQEPAGKLWWTMNMGSDPATLSPIASAQPFTTSANTN